MAITSNDRASRQEDAEHLVMMLKAARVGGNFWGHRPAIDSNRDILLAPVSDDQARTMLNDADADGTISRSILIGPWTTSGRAPALSSSCDPWHVVSHMAQVRAGADNEVALIAALCDKPLQIKGNGRFDRLGSAEASSDRLQVCVARELLHDFAFVDPFTGTPISAAKAIGQLAEWRQLIDSNRAIAAIFGVSGWKRVTLDALFWDGGRGLRYASPRSMRTHRLQAANKVLAWKTRTAVGLPRKLEAQGIAVGELEDGIIRSAGLGANCVPPLSIIVDLLGPHFDPAQPSTLELILQNDEISDEVLTRASRLREHLVRAGISKYEQSNSSIERPPGPRRRVLVPAQVEDDRAVICGGAGCTNLDLLRKARQIEPDAHIIYKHHPDVVAGHRKGFVPSEEILRHADEIESEKAMAGLIDTVDSVHVINSLAGFEALMRGKEVTTHGIPFYAGWGLTRDLGPVPRRRNRQRSLDELVAATLILYPRYLDPVTRLPCPVEILVNRLTTGDASVTSPLVRLREAQGRLNLVFKRITGKAG